MNTPTPWFELRTGGATRLVILIGRHAFKLPAIHFKGYRWQGLLTGLLANMSEARFARCGFPELLPVVFRIPGGFLNVMPRVRVMTPDEFADFPVDEFLDAGTYQIPAETKYDSFGYHAGRVVAIDYG